VVCYRGPDKTFEMYLELSNFDRLAGILGYIPKGLRTLIKQIINNKNKNEEKKIQKTISKTLKKIDKIILTGLHEIWLIRNKEWDKNTNKQINIIIPNTPIQYIRPQTTIPITPMEHKEKEIIDMTKN
jgi:hypothetical protein